MGWTKRQFIEQAFEEIGFAAYTFDLEPEQIESALRRLDSMMATWNGRGIRLGYPIPSSPQNSNLDDETGVPDSANEAIYANLAIRLAPSIGKSVSQETKACARDSYKLLLQQSAMPPQQQYPDTLPVGQGNKPWRFSQPYFSAPSDPIDVGPDGELDFD